MQHVVEVVPGLVGDEVVAGGHEHAVLVVVVVLAAAVKEAVVAHGRGRGGLEVIVKK